MRHDTATTTDDTAPCGGAGVAIASQPVPVTGDDDGRAPGEWRRGWPLVGAAMLGAGMGPGLYQNLSSLFTPGLQAAFGWTRGQIATAAGLALVGALAAPVVGRLADRVGLRPVITLSMLLLAAGYLGLSALAGPMWQYQACIVVLVMAIPGTSALVHGKILAAGFVRHRGLAMALGTSGLALMTMTAGPLLGWLIGARGWRAGFVALAVASAGVALPLILIATRGAAGTAPTRPEAGDGTMPPATGITAAEARRDRRFWIVVAGAALVNFATTGLVTQLVPLGLELGLSPETAPLLLTAFGLSAIAGRLGIGAMIDRVRPQPAAAGFALVSGLAFVLLALSPSRLEAVLVLVFLAGLMNGAENDLLPFLAARLFGLRAYAEIFGTAMPLALVGTGAGIAGFGVLHDVSGGYALPLSLGAIALLGAGACFLLLHDRDLPKAGR